MRPSVTVENYLKQICLRQQRSESAELVPMGGLAEAVGVTPGTATTMVKSLAEAGLVDYAPRAGVKLTTAGRSLAHRVLRRHRLVEQFLVEVLDMDWAEVHDEAEELEHAVSDKLLERIDARLGHPETDPHGSPIPRGNRPLPRDGGSGLDAATPGQSWTVSRIVDHDPAFLRFVEAHGLVPGATVRVVEQSPHAESTTVEAQGFGQVTLGRGAARRVRVA